MPAKTIGSDLVVHAEVAMDIDRHEDKRRKPDFLESRLAASSSPVVIVCRSDLRPGFASSMLVADKANPADSWMFPLEGAAGKPICDMKKAIYVGEDTATKRNIFITAPNNVAESLLRQGNSTFLNTRVLMERLDRHGVALLSTALSMFNWIAAVRFCPRCGGPLAVRDYGMFQKCTACAELHFPRINPAMIVCVLDGKGNVLLSQRKRKSFTAGAKAMLTVLSGFVSHGESMEETVVREVREESGAEVSSLRYVGSEPWPYPHQLMTCYYAVAEASPDLVVEKRELVSVAWVSKAEVQQALSGKHKTFFVPPRFSSAGSLLAAWADGRVNDRGEAVPTAKL
uniref:NAD(+) diphosphatase n=1 Tax=Herpetomonas muscarum TaxID=5718 RepID=T1YU27_HERMU|nr:NAD+ diphosphatase [Herpetomonas muscarum]